MREDLLNINIFNHNPASISDFVEILSREARSFGTTPVLTDRLFPDVYNVVIESFNPNFNKSIKRNFSKCDERLILIATEIVKDGILNSTSPDEDEEGGWYDTKAKHWVKRTKYFFDIIEYFGTVICVSEEIYKSLLSLNLEAKIVYWKPKFYGQVENFTERWKANNFRREKTHQLLYSGSLTTHRTAQIDSLSEAGITFLTTKQDTPDNVRHAFSRQSGFTFGPKHYRNTYQLSKMRVLWCLNNLYPVLMERCEGKTDLDEYCLFYDTVDEVVELVNNMKESYMSCMKLNLAFAMDSHANPSIFQDII